MEISVAHHQTLLGDNGTNARRIMLQSGTTICFPNPLTAASQQNTVQVTGLISNVLYARQLLLVSSSSLIQIIFRNNSARGWRYRLFTVFIAKCRPGGIVAELFNCYGRVMEQCSKQVPAAKLQGLYVDVLVLRTKRLLGSLTYTLIKHNWMQVELGQVMMHHNNCVSLFE